MPGTLTVELSDHEITFLQSSLDQAAEQYRGQGSRQRAGELGRELQRAADQLISDIRHALAAARPVTKM